MQKSLHFVEKIFYYFYKNMLYGIKKRAKCLTKGFPMLYLCCPI